MAALAGNEKKEKSRSKDFENQRLTFHKRTLDIGHWTREGRAKSKAQQILFPSCCLLPVAVRVL